MTETTGNEEGLPQSDEDTNDFDENAPPTDEARKEIQATYEGMSDTLTDLLLGGDSEPPKPRETSQASNSTLVDKASRSQLPKKTP